MAKKLLIISPYFPPSNAADMQRVRMSLPYFSNFGWVPEVVVVDERCPDIMKDDLLLKSIPDNVKIHKVKALDKKWTSKIGLGSVALRSLPFYFEKVNSLLATRQYNLVYFSTTQFPVCILGAYWKKKYNIPYVIDMQDPWHSEYYQDKPKEQQPKKYWFSYRLNKFLEPIAVKNCDGLISVSEGYINDMKERYPVIKDIPSATVTFGAFSRDFQIAHENKGKFKPLLLPGFTNIVYIGRGGMDMHKAIAPVFEQVKQGLKNQQEIYNKLKFYFIGTSYAPPGKGVQTILPLARQYGVENNIVEQTERISYYHTLSVLQQADALFIPGSDDPNYSASKLYTSLLTNKPLLAIFNSKSPALTILEEYGVKYAYSYDATPDLGHEINCFLAGLSSGNADKLQYNEKAMNKYSAENMTHRQCELFNEVIIIRR